jgi:sec-independent protein translocase protein TatA
MSPIELAPLALGLPGGNEIWIIVGVIVLFFGGAKIPELMRGMGKGVGELKKGLDEGKNAFKGVKDDVTKTLTEEPKEEAK